MQDRNEAIWWFRNSISNSKEVTEPLVYFERRESYQWITKSKYSRKISSGETIIIKMEGVGKNTVEVILK